MPTARAPPRIKSPMVCWRVFYTVPVRPILCASILALPIFGQVSSSLSGAVTDPDGAAVAGATVRARGAQNSSAEATAITSIQAMACGTPVVATANGAHLDAVVDGTTGILVQPLRPALLAQRIRALLAHPMLLEAFSVAATDRARSRYSWDRIAHETLAVYDTALAA